MKFRRGLLFSTVATFRVRTVVKSRKFYMTLFASLIDLPTKVWNTRRRAAHSPVLINEARIAAF